jgi:hypothetical protein
MRVHGRIAVLIVVLLAPWQVIADDATGQHWGGHIKLSAGTSRYAADDLAAQAAGRNAGYQDLDLRLKLERRRGPWRVDVHYELLGSFGDRAGGPGSTVAGGLPDDATRLLDLTGTVESDDGREMVQRIDRLSLSWARGRNVLRVGRQVVSWGNGLVFNPMDFFNPFPPLAVDKDYKTGDDMVYYQHLFAGGADAQAVLVPRRNRDSGSLRGDESTAAIKLHWRRGERELDLMLARHHDNTMAGLGAVGSWGGGVWRADWLVSEQAGQGPRSLLVANLDYSWQWFDRNVYGYVEYFRNGFGTADRDYARIPPELLGRIERGELFTLGRDYLATGLQLEWNPRCNLFPVALASLNDGSKLLQLRVHYDWRRNVMLSGGVQLSTGGRGSEYGGYLPAGGAGFVAPGDSAYARIAWYF